MKPELNKGQLIKWNDAKGFGFIKPTQGGKEVFLHISAVKTTARRPQVGDIIFYQVVTEENGKLRAAGALIQGVVSYASTAQPNKTATTKRKTKPSRLIETIIGAGIFAVIVLLQMQFDPRRTPPLSNRITNPNCTIKGNISIETGRKLYHMPGMEDYDGTLIDSGKGEKWFCSETEAEAAGWRKAPR